MQKFIFTQIKDAALANGYEVILDGSNLDDMKDYRPGQALGELGVFSPLKESGLTKQDIRDLSAYYGFTNRPPTGDVRLATRSYQHADYSGRSGGYRSREDFQIPGLKPIPVATALRYR